MGVFGTRLFGQADRVAGLFCVRTRFFHVNFIPLVPLASYLVFEQKGGSGNRGVELKKLRWNSVFLAWVRTPLWIACGISSVIGLCGSAAAPAWFADRRARDRYQEGWRFPYIRTPVPCLLARACITRRQCSCRSGRGHASKA